MYALMLIVAALPGVTEVWTESAMVNVYPDSDKPSRADASVRLYAAGGERESFQICIRGGRKGFEIKEVRAKPLAKNFEPPEIRRVGYLSLQASSPRAEGTGLLQPDPLLEFTPFTVPRGETRALWVTYEIPRDASPGRYKGTVEVVPTKGRLHRVSVTLEVFGFSLPERPTLRTSFRLDRDAIEAAYDLDPRDLDAWKPIYDAFSRGRISFGIASGGGLVTVDEEGVADTAAFKEHLEYAVEAARMNTIDIGFGDSATAPFPAPPEGSLEQDPLQVYLHDMNNWLQPRGWLKRAYLQPLPPIETEERQEARREYFRVWRADSRIHRLVVGTLHPSLERYTDIWAVPARYYQPFAQARLLAGRSLTAEPAYPAISVNASSSGGGGVHAFVDTVPDEAYDGSLFTSWISAEAPSRRNPQWLRIDLDERVRTDTIRIGWKPGLEPPDFVIKTSFDRRIFNNATVRFEHHRPFTPFDESWSEGRFRSAKTFCAIWLHFTEPSPAGPIGITEIEFGLPPDPETVERIDPLEIWAYSLPGDFPSLAADAPPGDPRLYPWLCRGHNARGMLYHPLNEWPEALVRQAPVAPEIWTGGGTGERFLYYPGPDGPIPSIRAERLRDGIDDFDYLARLDEAVGDGAAFDRTVLRWREPRVFPPDMTPAEVEEFLSRILEARRQIGNALTDHARASRGR